MMLNIDQPLVKVGNHILHSLDRNLVGKQV
jgi:hypothetical protein